MARNNGKTVFILGAGFSKAANLPLQGELLGAILTNGTECADKAKLLQYIHAVYGLTLEQAGALALEDIYTPLHQAISANQYLKTYSPEKLREIERALNLLIAHVINDRVGEADYAHTFADKILTQKRSAPTSDIVSIISLNWDILLDKIFFEKIKADKNAGGKQRGTLDYCCHTTGIDNQNQISPAILARAQRKYSVKLIKLHGSLNWVSCPQCSRLFINQTQKEGIKAFTGEAKCQKCNGDILLEAELALPTFQKDLKRFHFQHIWNQAAIELSEAARLVFIGYSFPLADFDFRSLITKHVGPDVEVDVVLYSNDEQPTDEGQRYQAYFGDKINDVHYCGVESYVENNFPL